MHRVIFFILMAIVAVALFVGVGGLALLAILALAILGGAGYVSVKAIGRLIGLNSGPKISTSLPQSVKRSLRESRHHGQLIIRTLEQCPPGLLRDRLTLMLRPVEEWLDSLTRLEQSLQKSYVQRNLPRDIRQIQLEIEKLRRHLLATTSEADTASIKALLNSKRQHLSILQELQAFQNRAELKIRKIASDLGATHAEMTLIIAKGDFNENRLSRLDQNLQEHVSGMRDILSTMDEMGYSTSSAS